MKKFTVLTLLVFSIATLFAQTDKKNVIKFYPTSPAFGKTTLGYERVLNENTSLTFNLGLPTGLNVASYLSTDDGEGLSVGTGKFKGILLMPGYRINLSKRAAPVGFYFESYLKYEHFDLGVEGDYLEDNGDISVSAIDGNYSGVGVGVQIGAQWLIADVVSVDLSFFGLEAKSSTIDVTWEDVSGTADINDLYNDLNDNVTDIPVVGDKIEVTKNENSVTAKLKRQFIPGFRFAFSVGIAF